MPIRAEEDLLRPGGAHVAFDQRNHLLRMVLVALRMNAMELAGFLRKTHPPQEPQDVGMRGRRSILDRIEHRQAPGRLAVSNATYPIVEVRMGFREGRMDVVTVSQAHVLEERLK